MTPFWLWVAAGCAACAVAGFSLVRVVARALPAVTGQTLRAGRVQTPAISRFPEIEEPAAVPAAAEVAAPDPAPTAPEPDAAKLELWTRQIQAGERKMSVATDGCRVTWNRRCKHGHPTWLVHLGYL